MTHPSTEGLPDAHGRFVPCGGQYIPETLMAAVKELILAYAKEQADRYG